MVSGEHIISTGGVLKNTVAQAIGDMDLTDMGSITMYYAEKGDEALAIDARDRVREEYPDLDVDALYGGQVKAHMLIAIE